MKTYSIKQNKTAILQGFKDGIPIGLGYFAVAFSLGIAAKNAGLTPFQAFITSALCHASAGEYAGFTVIAAAASFLEMATITLIANARYLHTFLQYRGLLPNRERSLLYQRLRKPRQGHRDGEGR